ncbi:MAG: class I SAM-dependent methyltransferase [Thermoanaerobaculia bacterium]
MNFSERILLSLSRTPDADDYTQKEGATTLDSALDLLTRVFPDFAALVSGKRLVDFGCGAGYQSIALALKYDGSVVGVEANPKMLATAIENARKYGVSSQKLSLVASTSPDMRNSFDVVISQNSFEHFANPEKVLEEMASLLTDSGIILITFGPPWFAPYGSHMHFFCKAPWVNVFFSERTVMKARSHFRKDGIMRYQDLAQGLNKMTLAKFESIISSCGLEVAYQKYEAIKRIDWLSRVPLLREAVTNHVTVILRRSAR